tara:strand:+ start:939 stop:1196 length:258 start_codon:yes stop_codon:yes gene_type:complete
MTNEKPIAITITGINKLISELKYGLIDEYNFLGDTDEDQIERFNEVKKWSLNKSEEDISSVGFIMGVEYTIRELEKLITNNNDKK